MSPTQQEAHRRHAEYYLGVLRSANSLYTRGYDNVGAGLRLFDLEWENIQTGQARSAAVSGNNPALSKLCIAYPKAGAHILLIRQHPKEGIQWSEAALSAARQVSDRGGEADALGNLGNAYADLGNVRKAIEFYEQVLIIDRENGNRQGEAADLGNLGRAYRVLGLVRQAIEFFEEVQSHLP